MVRSIAPIASIRARGRALHAGDLRADLLGRLGGLAGERLHLARHHREAAAGIAGARRLDGGVERQQIGLLGDVGDELDHVADAAGRLVELLDGRRWSTRPRSPPLRRWRSTARPAGRSRSPRRQARRRPEAMSRTLFDASAEAVAAPAVRCAALSAAPASRVEAASI